MRPRQSRPWEDCAGVHWDPLDPPGWVGKSAGEASTLLQLASQSGKVGRGEVEGRVEGQVE